MTNTPEKKVDYRAGFNAEIRRAMRHLKRHLQGLPGVGLQRAQEILEKADERVSTSFPAPWPGAYFPKWERPSVDRILAGKMDGQKNPTFGYSPLLFDRVWNDATEMIQAIKETRDFLWSKARRDPNEREIVRLLAEILDKMSFEIKPPMVPK